LLETWRFFFCEIFHREESYTRRKIRRKPRGTKHEATEYLEKLKVDASTPKRKCTKLSSSKTGKQKTRRISLGMMIDIKKKKYTRVSLVKGGGTRKVDLPCDFNREDVRYAVKLLAPRRRICRLYF